MEKCLELKWSTRKHPSRGLLIFPLLEENDNVVFCILNSAEKHGIYIQSLHTIKSTILGDILGAIIGLTLVNRNPIDYSISPNYVGFFLSILWAPYLGTSC